MRINKLIWVDSKVVPDIMSVNEETDTRTSYPLLICFYNEDGDYSSTVGYFDFDTTSFHQTDGTFIETSSIRAYAQIELAKEYKR